MRWQPGSTLAAILCVVAAAVPAAAAAAPAQGSRAFEEGLAAADAALFARFDEAADAHDAEALTALLTDDFVALPLGWDRRTLVGFLSHPTAKPRESRSLLLSAHHEPGGDVVVRVDHHVRLGPTEMVLPKLHWIRTDGERRRIAASLDVAADTSTDALGGTVTLEGPGVRIAAPPGWLSVRPSRDFLLDARLFVLPGLETWVTLGLIDPGPRELKEVQRWSLGLLTRQLPTTEVRSSDRVVLGGLPFERARLSLPRFPGAPSRYQDHLVALRGGIGLVARCESVSADPEAACDTALQAWGDRLTLLRVGASALRHFRERHATGVVEGRAFRQEDLGVRLTAPEGWRVERRGSSLPYVVALMPDERDTEVRVGALPWPMAAAPAARDGQRVRPFRHGGLDGWIVERTVPAHEESVAYLPAQTVTHFVVVERAGREGAALLELVLAAFELD